jgi:hypothetical protein
MSLEQVLLDQSSFGPFPFFKTKLTQRYTTFYQNVIVLVTGKYLQPSPLFAGLLPQSDHNKVLDCAENACQI